MDKGGAKKERTALTDHVLARLALPEHELVLVLGTPEAGHTKAEDMTSSPHMMLDHATRHCGGGVGGSERRKVGQGS